MQFARLNGVVIHHQVIGAAPEKPTIVFANSLGTDFRIWRDVIVRMVGDFSIIAYDKRGHGLSELGSGPISMNDHINDLEALIEHFDAKNVIVCGLSVGGMIAQGLAAKRPDLVKAMILMDTAHKIGTADMWNQRIEGVTRDGITSLADAIMQRWFTPAYRSPDKPDFVGYTAMLTRTTVDGYAGTCAALRDADFTESTKALTLPVLALVGDQDGSTPPDLVRSTAELVKGAEFRIIPDAGHLPCIEQPQAVVNLMSNFLKQARFS